MITNGIQIVAEARVGNDPELREVSGTPVCNVSLAVTERRQNKQTGQWEDGGTTWMRGAVWGSMAANVAQTLTKGMLVNVVGILSERKYTTEAGERSQLELRVEMLAPSLRFATATVIPNDRGGSRPQQQLPAQQYQPGVPGQQPWQGQQAPYQPGFPQGSPPMQQAPQAPQQAAQGQPQAFRSPLQGQPPQQPATLGSLMPGQQWATPAYQQAAGDDIPF